MVLQDAWLFGGTIRDNIAYGGHGATDEEILEAARISYVDRFVHSLPDGYDTIVDDQGSNLSAGERQLVTIARAFLADPAILILDEATSSVDTRTEVLVQQAMAALRADRTSFVIAHRLSTIRDADTILVMEDGRIVEQGDHDELLARRGAYYRLYNAQFTGPARRGRGAAERRRHVPRRCDARPSGAGSAGGVSRADTALYAADRGRRRSASAIVAEELADPLGGTADERPVGGDDQRPLHQRRVLGEHADDAVRRGDVVGGDVELVPALPPDEAGGFVLELGDDRPQLVGRRRRFEVLDDVDGELVARVRRRSAAPGATSCNGGCGTA